MTLIFWLSFLVGQQVYAHENKTQMDTVAIDGVKYSWEENIEGKILRANVYTEDKLTDKISINLNEGKIYCNDEEVGTIKEE